MAVRTYTPRIEVKLFGRNRQMDLTPFIGDHGQVVTSRSIYSPVGTANIQLSDKLDPATSESIYGLVHAMDGVTIRMASLGRPKIIMRGYVTQVRRAESIGSNGQPTRAVTITIADSGKLFQNVQVFHLKQYLLNNPLLTKFKFHEATGIDYRPMPAAEFFEEVLDLVNTYVAGFWLAAPQIDAQFVESGITVTEGVVQPFGVNASQGPIWNIMTQEADQPFNELFVEDREDAPYLVYRPTPFRDAGGAWIPQGGQSVTAETVTVPLDDVERVEVSRSDADVANFFWVRLDGSMIFRDTSILAWALENDSDSVYQQGYVNNDPEVFGDRKLEIAARHGYPGQEISYGNVSEKEWLDNQTGVLEWMEARREALKAMNQDNAVFESGTVSIRGNPDLRHGMYLAFKRGAIPQEYYVHTVQHAFLPFRKYSTNCHVMRGTGFINRQGVGAAGIAEGRRSAYGR